MSDDQVLYASMDAEARRMREPRTLEEYIEACGEEELDQFREGAQMIETVNRITQAARGE